MAAKLAAAIRARRKLRLSSLWDPTGCLAPSRAVFVWSGKDEDENEGRPTLVFVVTSAWFRNPVSETYNANNINRYVLLEVKLEEATSRL